MAIKKCNCGREPSFGFLTDKKRICCKYCKLPGMINLKSLNQNGCECGKTKNPAYGYEKDNKKICCAKCKKQGMINLKQKKWCECGKVPTYGLEKNIATHCKDCKTENMIDVKHDDSMCRCGKHRASFGFLKDEKATCCSGCKEDNMISITNLNTLCECGTRVGYGYKNQQPECCVKCRKSGMVDLVHSMCKNCKDWEYPTRGSNNYDGYCVPCFQQLFPLDPRTFKIPTKVKEQEVKNFINQNFEGFYHDRILEFGGCDCLHRRRVDHRKIINNTILAIETDEYQHTRYDEGYEEVRYNDLISYFTGKWIFIRFNPHIYIDENGDKQDPLMRDRLERLKKEMNKQIKRILKGKNTELIEIVHLFYNKI